MIISFLQTIMRTIALNGIQPCNLSNLLIGDIYHDIIQADKYFLEKAELQFSKKNSFLKSVGNKEDCSDIFYYR